MELQGKPDFERALQRLDAWFAHDMLDRPPVRFAEHNAEYVGGHALAGRAWLDLRARWFDAEFQVDGKGVLVDLQLHELEPFIAVVNPKNLYLCIAAPESSQPDILKRLEKW